MLVFDKAVTSISQCIQRNNWEELFSLIYLAFSLNCMLGKPCFRVIILPIKLKNLGYGGSCSNTNDYQYNVYGVQTKLT